MLLPTQYKIEHQCKNSNMSLIASMIWKKKNHDGPASANRIQFEWKESILITAVPIVTQEKKYKQTGGLINVHIAE